MKLKLIPLIFIITLLLASCSSAQNKDDNLDELRELVNERKEEEKKLQEKAGAEEEKEEDPIPDYIENFFTSYINYGEEYDLSYSIISEKINSAGDYYDYCFYFSDGRDPGKEGTVYFNESEDSVPIRTSEIFFEERFDSHSLKDFLAVTLLIIDSDLTFDEALEHSQEIANSYAPEHDSITYNGEEYSIFLRREYPAEDIICFLVHHDSINIPIDISDYKAFKHDELFAVLNYEEQLFIDGLVIDITRGDYADHLYVLAADGYIYDIIFDKNDFLDCFETEKTYTFYGENVTSGPDAEYACIRLEYFEPSAQQ